MSKLTKIRLATRIIEEECEKRGVRLEFLTEYDVLCSDNLGYAMLYLGLIQSSKLIAYIKSKNISEVVLPLVS